MPARQPELVQPALQLAAGHARLDLAQHVGAVHVHDARQSSNVHGNDTARLCQGNEEAVAHARAAAARDEAHAAELSGGVNQRAHLFARCGQGNEVGQARNGARGCSDELGAEPQRVDLLTRVPVRVSEPGVRVVGEIDSSGAQRSEKRLGRGL